jgi:acyl-coenzyme A thioesterase PaaI-like protein
MENWPRVSLPALNDGGMCFGCGEKNPIGLKMKFKWNEKTQTASSSFTPGETLQGWAGFVHGGVIACVLDEAMGWAAMFSGTNNITARMQVRYRQMVPIGKTYSVSCTIIKQNSRLIETEARIADPEGNILAEGTSIQFIVSPREGQTAKT